MFNITKEIGEYLKLIYEKIPPLEQECERCGRYCEKNISMSFIEYLNMKEFTISNKIELSYETKEKCIFLEMKDKAICTVYPVRPWICRVYRPYPKGVNVYYLDLKKLRTDEKCGYAVGNAKNGKAVPDEENIVPALMIAELQIALKGFIDAPEAFLHKDDTFLGWKEACKNHVKEIVARR